MSNKIDERIVEMSFDNKKFEQGISNSQKSLSDFKKSMDFKDSERSLESFAASWSKMGAVTFSVINNLTNKVVDFGLALAKSLTLDPIMDGMNDYNTKLTTMQTITNATGKSIAEVEVYFGQLDEYADKTIYNLTDMTSAMAKFVNANVDLDKAVPAIKGIANMTALAGQDANAASIAMYNLSQSIAGGFLTTMDYKSLNLANVATFEWKNNMIEAAVAAGKLKKGVNGYITPAGKAYSAAQLFTEGLKDQWATTDILLDVLGDYGDETTDIGKKAQAAAQDVKSFGMMMDTLKAAVGTGWTRSFELIIGNLEESKRLWTGISNAIGGFIDRVSDARNEMLQFWHDEGGRDAFLAGMKNVAIAVLKVLIQISKAFDQIFPPRTKEQFVAMFKAFENFTKTLIIGDGAADKIRRTFAGLFAVVDIVWRAFKTLGGVFGQIIKEFFPGLSGGLLGITANAGDFLVILHDLIVSGGFFEKVLETTGYLIHNFKTLVTNAFYAVVGFVAGLRDGSISLGFLGTSFSNLLTGVSEFIKGLFQGKSIVEAFSSAFKTINTAVTDGHKGFSLFGQSFQENLGHIKDFISMVIAKLLPALDWIGDKLGKITLKQVAAVAIGIGLIKLAKTLLSAFAPLGGVAEAFSGVLKSVSGAIKSFSLGIKAEAIFTIAKAIALLTLSLIALTFIDPKKLGVGLLFLTVMIGELVAATVLLNKIKNPAKIGIQLTTLSLGLFVIAKAAMTFSSMSWEGLAKAGAAIGGFMAMIVIFTKVMSKINPVQLTTTSNAMMTFGIAMIPFAAALMLLGKIPTNELIQGGIALSGLLVVIALYTKLVSKKGLENASKGMIALGIGLLALIASLVILAKLDSSTLIQGAVAMGAVLGVVALYTRLASDKGLKNASKGMIGLGVGLLALTASLAILGKMRPDTLVQGAMGITALMLAIALFMKLTNSKELKVTAGSLIGLGAGLLAMSAALAVLGSLDFASLLKGGIALTGLLLAIALFMKLTNEKELKVTAGAMIAFSAGIAILAGVMAILSMLDTAALLGAALALGGIIIAVAAFSKMTNLGSLAQSALGLGLFALALAGLSIPIKMIAEIPWQNLLATAATIVAVVGSFALIAAVMPMLSAAGAAAGPALIGAGVVLLVIAAIGAIAGLIGSIATPEMLTALQMGGEIFEAVGLAIGKLVGGIVGGIAEGLTAALPGIADNLAEFGEKMQPFFESIKTADSESIGAVKNLAEMLLILSGAAILDGIASLFGMGTSLTDFAEELKNFGQPFVDFCHILQSGNIDADVVNTASNAALTIANMAKNLPNSGGIAAVFAGDNTLTAFAEELKNFGQPFVEFCNILKGADIDTASVETAANAAAMIGNMAANLPNSGGLAAVFVGDNTLSSFATELAAFGEPFVAFCNIIKDADIDTASVQTAANAASIIGEMASKLPNQGGLVAVFTGDNTLSSFANELAAFGPGFVTFIKQIGSVTVSEATVRTAANAASMMSELANNLPNQGGIVAWFTGDNTLSAFADELVKFAPKFVQFVNEFGGIEASTVTPGIEALSSLVDMMKIAGADTMENLGQSFENNKAAQISKIKNVLDGVVSAVDSYKSKLTTSGENVVDGFVIGMGRKYASVKAKAYEIANAVKSTVDSTLGIHSPAQELIDRGKNTVQGFVNGMGDKKDALIGSVTNLTGSVKSEFGSLGTDSSLTSGLQGLLDSLTGTMDESAETFANGGKDSGNGFANALTNSDFSNSLNSFSNAGVAAVGKVKSAFEAFKDWLEEEKFYSRIDTAGEIAAWEEQQKLYKEGTEERKNIDRELYTLRKRLIEETYKAEMDAIEELNYYGQLSLEEELAMLREIREEFAEGSEERKKLDREIFALEKKIYEAQKQYVEDLNKLYAESAQKKLEAQKKYDDSVTKAGNTAAKKSADANKKYTDETIKIAKDGAKKRADIEKDFADDVEKIHSQLLKDVEAAEKRYTDAVKSRADTIYGYFGLFDAVGEKTSYTAEELLKNLSDQNAELEDWRSTLEMLSQRGVSDQLIKELQELGVSSNGQLKALNAMTDEQLAEYMGMFERKHEIANFRATAELGEYRKEVNAEIAALYAQEDADIKARLEKFNESLLELQASLAAELAEAEATLNETLSEINMDLEEAMAEAKKTLDEELDEINKDTEEKLKTLEENFAETMETIKDKTADEYAAMTKQMKESMKTINTDAKSELTILENTFDTKTKAASGNLSKNIKDGTDASKNTLSNFSGSVPQIFAGFANSLFQVGSDGASGLARGLTSGEYQVRIAGQSLGQAALNAAKAALNEHSPSKEMEIVGKFADQGLANGLIKYTSLVRDAGEKVGETSIDALSNSLRGLAELDLDNLDTQPVITPILDLSQVKLGLSGLDTLLNSNKKYEIGVVSRVQAARVAASQNEGKTSESSIINQFTIPNLVVREEADIDRIADKLFRKQQTAMRGRGARTAFGTT